MYAEFHAISCTPSRNFNTISHNFGYFSHFWANFNMLGIKMHVTELRNSMVILSRTFTHSFMQCHAIFTQFQTNLAILAILGQFQHVGYQNVCTLAEKCHGDTFIHFDALLHTI